MQDYLTQAQNNKYETKILNAIFTCFTETKNLEKTVIELLQEVKKLKIIQNAETLNSDIQEDTLQEGTINKDTGSAVQEE